MPDLRDVVEDDRGLIKKIQLSIPGYRGYRKREDLRIADSLLREEVAKRMTHVEKDAIEIRKLLGEAMEMDRMNDLKGLIYDIQTFRNRIEHAEQEYSGISADYRILENELEALYEYDLKLFSSVDRIRNELKGVDPTLDDASFKVKVKEVRAVMKDLMEDYDLRTETIANMVVRK